ncbi:D-glycero-beta-D-manno-heptose 1,7-bisphosphate 7-phosphatase [Gallibacterium genomosp. 3]|uniref:D,D-heptose 1,7-bisphosphate phosphatase n=1 Tax=Gallibacterium genomosp. 3 TaxID=505345 RepID=A0A1A7Q4C6_9PAST|nr:D-glycero-beta-D-manno-heptose 1,7-bisphosphate 7-phosphatase [Gallibacterium genomosp. 3]OBX08936.1 D,D-heptose 1,7-bisphosphate phosphatase [Gallibacterium genomosp. 3]
MKKAIFLDRDGTLNIDHGYVHTIDQFQFIEGSIEALKVLQDMGYALVLVTNQSGIARGYYTEEEFNQLTEWMDWSLEDRGVHLDGIYYCPHHPEGIGEYRQECDCRKPKAGMLLEAIRDLHLDPNQSIMVGDKLDDVLAGQAANIKHTVLVKTGKDISTEIAAKADYVIDSIAELPELVKEINFKEFKK